MTFHVFAFCFLVKKFSGAAMADRRKYLNWLTVIAAVVIVGTGCQHASPMLSTSDTPTKPADAHVRGDSNAKPIVMPPLESIGDNPNGRLQLHVAVAGSLGTGLTIDLEIRITNPSTQPFDFMRFDYLRPEHCFAVWIVHNGHQVELTDYGKIVQPRDWLDGEWSDGGPSQRVLPGEAQVLHVDLTKLFLLQESGEDGSFNVVVKDGPIWLNDDSSRLMGSLGVAKTAFEIPREDFAPRKL